MTDRELLNAYIKGGSQDAFRTLVLRYIDLVYAAAVRKVGNAALAEDVAQAVFIVLSRRAARIHDARFLPAWLIQVTRFCAADARRAEARRRAHEKEAGAMTHDTTATEDLAPHLDAALEQLTPADRTAVLLRYYQQQSFADVGTSLGVSEDAAKKRLARALEKLRKIFTRQGMTFSAALLATAVARQALAAPHALAEKACAAALAKTAAAGTAALIAKGALKLMAWTTAKIAAATAAAVLVLSVGTVGVVHVLSHSPAIAHPTPPTPPTVAAAAPAAPVQPGDPPGLTVRDALGRPLSNVWVTVEGARGRPPLTDRQGHLDLGALNLSSGQLVLNSMRSRRMAVMMLPASYSPETPLDVTCDCFAATADGVVIDSVGDPVPGVVVNVFIATPDGQTFRFPSDKTDSTGYFSAAIPAKKGYACWASLANNPNDPATTGHIPLGDQYQVELPDLRLKTASGTPAASDVKRVHYGGRVVDEQGHPIPNVELDMSYPRNHMSYPAGDLLTDADGRFSRLLPPDADRIEIRLTARDYIGYQFERGSRMVSTDALKAGTAVITMKRGLPLSGVVTDTAGKPLSNALVLTAGMYSSVIGGEIIEDYTSPRTDNDGRFTATGLPAGPAHLQIFADGYAPQLATVDLSATTAPLRITLQSGLTYTARVTDPSGNPLSEASVEVERWRATNQTIFAVARSARTDSDGNFTLTDLPREGMLEIHFGKKKFVSMTLNWTTGAQNPEKIVLLPTPVITGVALDDVTGRPVPDFTVFPAWYNHNEPFIIEFSKSKMVHSEQGRFSLAITNFGAWVDHPDPMAVRIVADGYLPQFSPPVPLDGKKHSVTIRLHAAAPITGTLRDAAHQPVANAKVFISGAKNVTQIQGIAFNDAFVAAPTDIVTTDDDGAFTLPATKPPAKLVALCPSGYVLVDAATLIPDAALTLTPWATVEGTLEKDGHPQNGVALRLIDPTEDLGAPVQVHFDLVATTDIHGHFRFQHVPNIPLRLIKNDTNEPLAALIHPEPGKTITVHLQDGAGK